MSRCTSGILTLGLLMTGSLGVLAAELDVPLEKVGVKEPAGMMRRYLLRQVEQATRRWQAEFETLKTPTFLDTPEGMDNARWDPEHAKLETPRKVLAYQNRLRQEVLRAIGGLPEPAPLEPKVVGTVARPGYRIEKVIFQSQPKHYVTALLYLPDQAKLKPPYPGVLLACGHSFAGKASGCGQMMAALLAVNGMAALTFDPIDQGERLQYLGDLKKIYANVWPTTRHTMVGMGSLLLGRNTARFEIWDGMRAIDYLQSRPEIDGRRIGCCGCSGGGTQTMYLMALDDRVRCAAPSCSCTTMLRLATDPGVQDSEQNIFGQLSFGVDHPQWMMMRAPVPILLCAATKDGYFSIEGVWETYRWAKRLYTDVHFPERLEIIESNTPHGYHITHREGTARWMSRWLLGKDSIITETNVAMLTEKECQCTPGGQVMLLPGARSAYDLNEDYENELARRRKSSWATGDRAAMLAEVRRLAGIRPLADLPRPRVEKCGGVDRSGFRIERLAIMPEEGIVLPALVFLPKDPKPGGIVLYLHDQGKAADAQSDGPIERLVGRARRFWRLIFGGSAKLAPPTMIPTTPIVGRTSTRPICWAARTWECEPRTYSFAPGTPSRNWPAGGKAASRWWPSAMSAYRLSTPRLWSRRCCKACESLECSHPGPTSFTTA